MNIIYTILISLIFVCSKTYLFTQEIITDRPDQSESPYIVTKNRIQIEAGVVSENDEPVKDNKTSVLTAPEVLIRYGLADNIELRAGMSFLSSKYTYNSSSESSSGLSPLSIGTKIKIFNEKKSLPQTSLILNVTLPFKEKSKFQSDYIGCEFKFTMQNTLSKRFNLTYNLGGQFGEGFPGAIGIYTISLGANIIKNLSAFAELYGFTLQKNSPDHRADFGITYVVIQNIQADLSFGLGISKKSPDYFIGGGVSVRLPK